MDNDKIVEIQACVSKSQISEALQLLRELVQGDKESEITVLTLLAEYNEISIAANRGTISQEDLSRRKSNINVNILKAANQLALSNNEVISIPEVYARKTSSSKSATKILAVLTIAFFLTFSATVIFFIENNMTSNSKRDVIIVFIYLGTLYGGIISFVGLIVSLIFNALRR